MNEREVCPILNIVNDTDDVLTLAFLCASAVVFVYLLIGGGE